MLSAIAIYAVPSSYQEEGQMVAFSDVKRILHSKTWCEGDLTANKVEDELSHMVLSISTKCFNLEYELPLNKRFVKQLQSIMLTRGFIIEGSLPQTIFGKSQPDVTIYRTDGRYIREKTIVGASVFKGEQWEVIGATELCTVGIHNL